MRDEDIVVDEDEGGVEDQLPRSDPQPITSFCLHPNSPDKPKIQIRQDITKNDDS